MPEVFTTQKVTKRLTLDAGASASEMVSRLTGLGHEARVVDGEDNVVEVIIYPLQLPSIRHEVLRFAKDPTSSGGLELGSEDADTYLRTSNTPDADWESYWAERDDGTRQVGGTRTFPEVG